jgi:DNA-binding transcriptional LysR family regulator
MRIPRRFLPPTALLVAFEAAARTGSFTRAADELNLTQSAVSRQIRALEEQLGAELFVRERQSVRLTEAGEGYAREIRAALRHIGGASLSLRATPNKASLNLAILPTFGARWLMPRIGGFLAANPDITVHFHTRLEPFEFETEPFDAAIHFGHPAWRDADSMPLMRETVLPLAAASVAASGRYEAAEDLLAAPLMHLSSRADAWERWFAANGVYCDVLHGPVFDQFELIAQAARAGLGLALLPQFLFAPEIGRGELVPVLRTVLESDEAYHFVWPTNKAGNRHMRLFRDWIAGEARREEAGRLRSIA